LQARVGDLRHADVLLAGDARIGARQRPEQRGRPRVRETYDSHLNRHVCKPRLRMTSRLAILAVCIAAPAVVVPAATAHPLVGKREFQRRANAVCTGYNRKLNAIPKPQGQTDLVPYIEKSVALAKAQTRDLGALKPPLVFVRPFARMQALG